MVGVNPIQSTVGIEHRVICEGKHLPSLNNNLQSIQRIYVFFCTIATVNAFCFHLPAAAASAGSYGPFFCPDKHGIKAQSLTLPPTP